MHFPTAPALFMQLHLVRHGQTHWNAIRRIQGQLDSELDDTGRAQAAALAPRLATLGIGAVYCSTSLRTRQTAELALDPPIEPIVYRDELREICLGAWEGRLWDDVTGEFPEQVEHLRAVTPGFDVEGAESYVELQQRGVAAIERIISENAAEIVLVVSHGALLKTILAHYAGHPLTMLRKLPSLGNCAHASLQADGAERRVLMIESEPFNESIWSRRIA